MASVLPPFVEALPDGVIRVSLPTPFHVGRVNCYLLVDPPVTRRRPRYPAGGLDRRAGGCAGLHRSRLRRRRQIVVTHAHADHFGAAAAIAARSGARIVCGLPERAGLLGPRDPQRSTRAAGSLGVPEPAARSLVAATRRRARASGRMGRSEHRCGCPGWGPPGRRRSSARVCGQLRARRGPCLCGTRLPASCSVAIICWPASSPSPVSNAAMGQAAAQLGRVPGRTATVRRLDPAVLLPGHGRAFTEMAVLNAWLHSHSRQRADDIATILLDRPATPFEIAHRLQWQPEGARLLVGLAHVQGHLDLLRRDRPRHRCHHRGPRCVTAPRVTAA